MSFNRPVSRIVILSQDQIDNPTSRQVDDTLATYILDTAPYTRYWSNGTNLAMVGQPDVIHADNPQFGGYWNGTVDDLPAIRAAAAYAATFTPRKSIVLPPTVCAKIGASGIGSYIPSRVHVIGYSYSPGRCETRIYPHADSLPGFVFGLNTEDGTTEAETANNGASHECGIFGVMLHVAPDLAGIRLATFASTFIAHDCRGYRHTQLFKKVPGVYLDQMEFRRIDVALSHDNSEYAIELGAGGGDAAILESITFGLRQIQHLAEPWRDMTDAEVREADATLRAVVSPAA